MVGYTGGGKGARETDGEVKDEAVMFRRGGERQRWEPKKERKGW